MSMWRCPHCGTPQAETARCWVCRRSSTTCSTCRHYRQSVAAQLGYCGLDRKRLPLAGTELRGCWEPAAARPEPGPATPVRTSGHAGPLRLRDFVPVELVTRATPAAPVEPPPDPVAVSSARLDQDPGWSERVTLFGEADA